MPVNSSRFTLSVSVKPYVKVYLELNYGSPVCFSSDPESHKKFSDWFHKPKKHNDRKITDLIPYYTSSVEISISEHDFYKYGWELTKTNTVSFNLYFEKKIKLFMRIILGAQVSMGITICKSILIFQKKYGYTEEIWSFDSIKKDFYRNGYYELVDLEIDISNKIHKIIMRTLSDSGTLSAKAINYYENNHKTE